MVIEISKALKDKLPTAEQATIEDALWDKSGTRCWLCEGALNRAADKIQADHDIPEAEGGPTELSNLNLVHASCNQAKRNAKSVDIRPYLRLVAYSKGIAGSLKYDGYLQHFDVVPSASVLSKSGREVKFEFPDGTTASAPVYAEENKTGTFEYVFVQVPREAIFNDDECQPRAIRLDHAWSIYNDLQRNVLHEPPSLRVEEEVMDRPVKLLLFDGQHKTIASWMLGRNVVTAKIYLNLSAARANELVNSIQAKIKKLPLSPFELAGKMSDEFENKFKEYEDAVGAHEVSEDGFVKWLPQQERSRAKQALQSALIQNVLTSPDLRLSRHVKKTGVPAGPFSFTEQQLKAKVLEKLLIKTPQEAKGEAAQRIRDAEAANIVRVLNVWNDLAFESADAGVPLTDVQIERARRMAYQASLSQITELIRKIWNREAFGDLKRPMAETVSDDQFSKVEAGIRLIVDHPVWTAEFDRDQRMAAVKAALEKNQGESTAFEDVAFHLSYAVVGREDPSFKAYWH